MSDERGQALVELVAGAPIVLTVGAVLAQLLATGYSAVLAGQAAETGALAAGNGVGVRAAVEGALPGWSKAHARVRVEGGAVRVTLRPPSPLTVLARQLEVTRDAEVMLP